jgi:hypothetical protein
MGTIYRAPIRVRPPRVVRQTVNGLRFLWQLTVVAAALFAVGAGAFFVAIGYGHG